MKDHDLNFANEGSFFKNKFHQTSPSFYDIKTSTGYYPNPFPVGVAIFETPWYLLAEGYINISRYADHNSLSGFTVIHDTFINFGNIFYGFLGLIVVYKFLRLYFNESVSLATIFSIFFATPLIYMTIYEAAWSHLLSFFLVSSFIYFCTAPNKVPDHVRYILIGCLIGLCFMVRWQNILLLILVVPILFQLFSNNKQNFIKYFAVLVISLFITISPQLIAWRILYGAYLLKPPSNTNFVYLQNPQIIPFLFSLRHGMFLWTPIYLLSLIGICYLAKKKPRFVLPLIIFLGAELYINTSINDWWSGYFGSRRMLDYSIIYALGIASIMQLKIKYLKYFWNCVLFMLIAINFLLILQVARGWLTLSEPHKTHPINQVSGTSFPTPKQFLLNSQRIVKAVYRVINPF
ncbi:MAG: hypothetical protein Q7S57_04095 [bacterium]|nr:hypothetical protein [bacterium]